MSSIKPTVQCTCRADLEKSLLDRFVAHQPEGSGHSIELQGYGFAIVGDSMISAPFMEYKATAKFPVKKTGGTKEKTVRGNMMFSFCPFCGQKISKT